ncbi:MAG: hypothetical protein C0614_03835 [Desulfuromonas sp.]|nr:MAG: hypothetical protein C0614_03835 [Desulfuromonas sp.]
MSSARPQPSRNQTLRRNLVWGVVLAFLLLTGWLSWVVATFDANDYRSVLETRLQQRLNLPIRIGHIDLDLHGILLSLHTRETLIGDDSSSWQADLPETWIDLRWTGLFNQNVEIQRVTVIDPLVRISLAQDEKGKSAKIAPEFLPFKILHQEISNISLKRFEVDGGQVELVVDSFDQQQTSTFDNLHGSINRLAAQNRTVLELKGGFQLPGQQHGSSFSSHAVIRHGALPDLVLPPMEVSIDISSLDATAASRALIPLASEAVIHGRADLHLEADIGADKRAFVQLGVKGDNLSIGGFKGAEQPVTLGQLQASGRWHGEKGEHRISELAIDLDGIRLSGALTWPTDSSKQKLIQIDQGFAPTSALLPWLQSQGATLPVDLDPSQGELWLEQTVIRHSTGKAGLGGWQLEQGEGTLRNLRWVSAPSIDGTLKTVHFTYRDDRLALDKGQATIAQIPVTFTAAIDRLSNPDRELSLAVSSSIEAQQLPKFVSEQFPGWLLEGEIPLKGRIYGGMTALHFEATAELQQASLFREQTLNLQPREGDSLKISGLFEEQQAIIELATLNWSSLEGQAKGRFPLSNPQELSLEGEISTADLAELSNIAPALHELGLSGQATLSFSQQGPWAGNFPELTLDLNEVGIKTGPVLANLSQINGRLTIKQDELASEQLQARLGNSPFSASFKLTGFDEPLVEAWLEAESIRADELIFSSDRRMLRNLRGHLLLDRRAILLDPVTLELDNGTRPTVHGTITLEPPVEVELDIRSDFADISEIIALWTDRSESTAQAADRHPNHSASPPKVVIRAEAKQGNLYGMQFHSATGIIRPKRGQLIIHPLDFQVGNGYCNAQVLVDFLPEHRTLLRISGHGEDLDALQIYQELLNQKNIVRGRLRGDFYLQGLIGSNYLPSSYGEFNIEIRDGVLHKFPVLSKVFSLLNVSQLFNFELPDMDREGMPFDKLKGHFTLAQGVLNSDDLAIRSNAMNQSFQGSIDLIDRKVDMLMAVQPLGTVDKVVSQLPVAGWLLTGEEKALLTTHFSISGPLEGEVDVLPVPVTSLSETTLGLIQRALNLPLKLITDPQIIWGSRKKEED